MAAKGISEDAYAHVLLSRNVPSGCTGKPLLGAGERKTRSQRTGFSEADPSRGEDAQNQAAELDVRLLGDLERVVDFYAQISHGALDLAVT